MMQQNNIPSIALLLAESDGKVQCTTANGEELALLKHGKQLACIFVPTLMVEQQLAYKDYVLYLFQNEDALDIKKIQQYEDHALVVVGTGKQRLVYFIEDKRLVFGKPLSICCKDHLYLTDKLHTSSEGKATSKEPYFLNKLILFLRNAAHRGNEAEISGTRVGMNVFSRDFAPCNAIVAQRKRDNQFVLYHSTSANMDKQRAGVGLFLKGIEQGEGFTFAAVMQNPKSKSNRLKAPMLAAQLAIQLKDQNINRINIPEGYGAIACVNGDTIIMAKDLEFFKSESDKRQLLSQFKIPNEDGVRFIKLDKECIPLSETADELMEQFNMEKNGSLMKEVYSDLLGQLGIFNLEQKQLSEAKKKFCSFM